MEQKRSLGQRKMRRLSHQGWSIVVVVVTVSMWFSAGLRAQDGKTGQRSQAPFSLTITADEPKVKAGAPLWVDVTMKNESDHTLSVYLANSSDMDQGGWVYKVSAWDDTGAMAPKTEFGKRVQDPETPEEKAESSNSVMVGSGGYIPLPSGKTMKHRINITEIRDLERPGKYTIQVEEFDDETKTSVKSNKITVTVIP
jgi:hypothetical protein